MADVEDLRSASEEEEESEDEYAYESEASTDPVADGIDVTRAEFEYAVTHEGALTSEDILDRRTRIGLVEDDFARAEAAAEEMLDRAS